MVPDVLQAVGDFLDKERQRNQATAEYLLANSAVRGGRGSAGAAAAGADDGDED